MKRFLNDFSLSESITKTYEIRLYKNGDCELVIPWAADEIAAYLDPTTNRSNLGSRTRENLVSYADKNTDLLEVFNNIIAEDLLESEKALERISRITAEAERRIVNDYNFALEDK